MTDYSQIYADNLSYYREKTLDTLTGLLTNEYKHAESQHTGEISILALNIVGSMAEALIKAISEKTKEVTCVFDKDKKFLGVFLNEETARNLYQKDSVVIGRCLTEQLRIFSAPTFENLITEERR